MPCRSLRLTLSFKASHDQRECESACQNPKLAEAAEMIRRSSCQLEPSWFPAFVAVVSAEGLRGLD
jgi:hypothetical protein